MYPLLRSITFLVSAAALAGPGTPSAEPRVRQLWAVLGETDPAVARRAADGLVARPAETVRLLSEQLRPVPAPDPGQVAAWAAALDSDSFREREAATRGLAGLGETVEPDLKSALSHSVSSEARTRLERLLARLRRDRLHPSADRRRQARAIEVLERIGDPAARDLLAALAGGAPAARPTVDAAAALDRLSRVGEGGR